MKLVCVWADTVDSVSAAYELLAFADEPPQRVTWRLTASFNGTPIGDACFAPDSEAIRAAYRSDGLEVVADDVPDPDDFD